MESPHLSIYPFLRTFPHLFYQSWSQPNYFCQPAPHLPSKQVETRQSLAQARKALNQQTERPPQNDPICKPPKSKKAIEKEKLTRKREREDNYQRKKQKKDRNLPSNIFKNLANFFYLNPHILQFIKKLVPAGLIVCPQNLVSKFKEAVRFGQSYIRPVVVQSLCKEGSFSKQQALVFRIVLRRFLLVEMPVVIMSQSKLKRKQRSQYIKMGRKLYGQLNKGVFQ